MVGVNITINISCEKTLENNRFSRVFSHDVKCRFYFNEIEH